MSENTSAFFAVIPAPVLHDSELPPNARLLYAEITTLCNERGYCWATNAYFCERFGLKDRAVRGLIEQLIKKEYIRSEVVRDEKNAVVERKIWIDKLPVILAPPSGKILPEVRQKNAPPSGKNLPVEYKNNNIYPPIVPQEGDAPKQKRKHREGYKAQPDWEPLLFERFWTLYPRGEDKQGAIREWDRLMPDPALMQIMSDALKQQLGSDDWVKGVGIPYACRWLKYHRWEDTDKKQAVTQSESSSVWADDPEVRYV